MLEDDIEQSRRGGLASHEVVFRHDRRLAYALPPGFGRGSEATNDVSGCRMRKISVVAHRGRAYAGKNATANVSFTAR